jgi:hypothetical protein
MNSLEYYVSTLLGESAGGPGVPASSIPVSVAASLMHLSFRGDLEGVWRPRNPHGDGHSVGGQHSEPDLPRVSLAPTVEDCFRAIYPNVAHYFEHHKYPHMDFHVYRPVFQGSETVVTPQELTRSRMVHDAHMTSEYCVLSRLRMRHAGRVRVFSTNCSPFLSHHPFADRLRDSISFAPRDVRWKALPNRKG